MLGSLTENRREEIINELRERNLPDVKKELNLHIERAHDVESRRMELTSSLMSLNSNSNQELPTS